MSFITKIILFFLLLFLAGFLNFISSLYSDIDISKIDLSQINRKKKSTKLIIYVIKNNYFLFVGTSILSVLLNVGISQIIFASEFLEWQTELFILLLIVIITEVMVRYFAELKFVKRFLLNPFLLVSAYLISRLIAWLLYWMIKEKKLSPYKEQDLIRLMSNLEAERILEPQEARLLKAAFNFDEETIAKYFKPRKKTILLNYNMSFKEIQQIYFKYRFTRYPVLSEEKKIIGILNFKTLSLEMKTLFSTKRVNSSWENDWQNFIKKKN